MLADMRVALSQFAPSSIRLPAYEEYEDFVEGTLQFGDETLSIYYEHSLSYLGARARIPFEMLLHTFNHVQQSARKSPTNFQNGAFDPFSDVSDLQSAFDLAATSSKRPD
jgi:hypothetical protein